MLSDDDQEVVRFLYTLGEGIMAAKPTSTRGSTVSDPGSFNPYLRFKEDFRHRGIHQRSKWDRIGKPLFTPAFEMVMFFTPMNPFVYRGLRSLKLLLDEGYFDGVSAPRIGSDNPYTSKEQQEALTEMYTNN